MVLLCAWTAAALTPPERDVLSKTAAFLDRVGDKASAERLRSALNKGTVKFGATAGNENASCPVGKEDVTINPAVLASFSVPGQEFAAVADLAATLKHEFKHADQDALKFAKDEAVHRGISGGFHASEAEAWQVAFQSYFDWIQHFQARMSNPSLPAVQREKAAAECFALTKSFEVYRNCYVDNQFGPMSLNILGLKTPLDDAFLTVKSIRDSAYKLFAEAVYAGKVHPFGSGEDPKLHFSVKDGWIDGRLYGKPFFKGPAVYRGALDYGAVLECRLSGKVLPNKTVEIHIKGTLVARAGTSQVEGKLTGRFTADGQGMQGNFVVYPADRPNQQMGGKWEAWK